MLPIFALIRRLHWRADFIIEDTRENPNMAIEREREAVRERVKITREGTCEYGFRAPVFCVVIEETCPKDLEEKLCAFS
jgi:hypothetical protein